MVDVDGRILSIQSHVAFGYVGGKAAVFPLQCLGYDVDVINSVNFSNHSGYPRTGGGKATAADLADMFVRLEENELLSPSRLLTGYVYGAESLSEVAKLAQKLRRNNPNLIYLLDPVMGDGGRLYVAQEVIPVYQDMLRLATIITPNWFEVQTLTGIELQDLASLRQAVKTLHEKYGVPNVVISSIPLYKWLLTALPPSIKPTEPDKEHLIIISSSVNYGSSQQPGIHAQIVPLLPGYFSGVGDLFSALLLAHFNPKSGGTSSTQSPLSVATSLALTKTHLILERTHEHASNLPEEERHPTDDENDKAEPLRKSRRMRGRELRLVQSMGILMGEDALKIRSMELWEDFWRL